MKKLGKKNTNKIKSSIATDTEMMQMCGFLNFYSVLLIDIIDIINDLFINHG